MFQLGQSNNAFSFLLGYRRRVAMFHRKQFSYVCPKNRDGQITVRWSSIINTDLGWLPASPSPLAHGQASPWWSKPNIRGYRWTENQENCLYLKHGTQKLVDKERLPMQTSNLLQPSPVPFEPHCWTEARCEHHLGLSEHWVQLPPNLLFLWATLWYTIKLGCTYIP